MSSSKPANERLARYLRDRVRSTAEALAYLERCGVASYIAQRAVSACQARGLLDDRTCARLVASHWARQGYAWAAIRVKLAQKGLNDSAIATAAAEVGARPQDDVERARRTVASYHRRHAGAIPVGRLARHLSVRGFDSDILSELLGSFAESD